MCKPNSLYCKKGKFALGSCTQCKAGNSKKKYNGTTYCSNWAWWVWFLLALGMLLALLLLTMLVYGIFYCCQRFCGCCKQKKEKKKLIVEETCVYSKPPPVVHHVQAPVHHVVEHKPSHHSHARVEYGQPRITYGQSTVNEYREHAPSHMERRHVETRQLSPDRHNVVTHNEPVDWAKESRVRYAAPNQVSHVSGDHQQYSHMNPFHS